MAEQLVFVFVAYGGGWVSEFFFSSRTLLRVHHDVMEGRTFASLLALNLDSRGKDNWDLEVVKSCSRVRVETISCRNHFSYSL